MLLSWQGPEHCHIDFCKRLAACTNNKDVFLTILRCHVREGHLQYIQMMETDVRDCILDVEPDLQDEDDSLGSKIVDKNESISCDLGIRYPTLQAILSGKKNIQTTHVHTLQNILDNTMNLQYELCY